jgi:hypothetical protein
MVTAVGTVRRVLSEVTGNAVEQWFSTWYMWPPRGPREVSKGPQENEGKLGPHTNFGWATETFLSEKNISNLKLNQRHPSPLHLPQHRRQKLYFIVFPTCHLVGCGFSCVTHWLSKVSKCLDVVKADDLRLSLTALRSDRHELATVYHTEGAHTI